jgi:CRISPR/Cas system-associated exonuclease Cas4 (RecB family)
MDYAPYKQRIKEPPNPIFEKGNRMHKEMEEGIRDGKELSSEVANMKPLVEAIRRQPIVQVEQKQALSEDRKPLPDFFDKQTWVRVIWDVMAFDQSQVVGFIGDFKSGRVRPDSDQLQLFAAAAFDTIPTLERVTSSFIFMEHNKFTQETYERKQAPHIWQKFGEEVHEIEHSMETGEWTPRPGHHCKYCPVPKSHCPHSHKE